MPANDAADSHTYASEHGRVVSKCYIKNVTFTDFLGENRALNETHQTVHARKDKAK